MHNSEILNVLQLINTDGVGPVTFYKLLQKYGSAEKALGELSRQKDIFPRRNAEKELDQAQHLGIELILYTDPRYPEKLKNLNDAPPILYALGNIKLLNYPISLAIVGARNASIAGRKMASRIAYDLTNSEVLVVSGMARGIDSAAHKGSLYAQNQQGATIAVLGTGVDKIYPEENKNLYQQIKNQGLLISEFPLGTTAQTSNFPRRNRIVSGLSKGTLVIEASLRSGSLITAHQALDQGRDVYAVPGAPYDDRCAGCNKLLREGAILVENAEDIASNFTFSPVEFTVRKSKNLETADLFDYSLDNQENNSDIARQDKYAVLLSLISEQGEDIDDIIRNLGLPTEEVLTMIVELELNNKIIRLPCNRIARV